MKEEKKFYLVALFDNRSDPIFSLFSKKDDAIKDAKDSLKEYPYLNIKVYPKNKLYNFEFFAEIGDDGDYISVEEIQVQ